MARPVTIFTGQWADLGLEEMCRTAKDMRYDELGIASQGQIDLQKATEDPEYVKNLKGTLEEHGLGCRAIGTHLPGRCVGDVWDLRLNGFAPPELAGRPEEIRAWGIQQLKYAAMTAKTMGVKVVTGFAGSPIWRMWYSFPQTTEEMVKEGFKQIGELWTPILDVFDQCGVKLALEVHPTEITFDYYNAQKPLEVFEYREMLGINFDPSHLIWQGMDPAMLLYDFTSRVYHAHIKDTAVNLSGRDGVLDSHIAFGDPRRGWNFVSPGRGDVDFDEIIRMLNVKSYEGSLSTEWEDSGMDRIFGGTGACVFTKRVNLSPSDIVFGDALKTR